MAYNSYLYIVVFLGLTLLLYYAVPKRFRWIILLLASWVFYYLSSGNLIIYLLISTASVYICGLWLGRIIESYENAKASVPREERKAFSDRTARRKKLVVFLALLVNFGLLAFLKYSNFFADNANTISKLLNLNVLIRSRRITLPLGISFYTLMAASYIIDVYRGKCRADKNPARIALFLSFFPHIVEGPFGRYDHLAGQLYEGHPFSYRELTFGAQLIIWGLFKKIVIADRVNIVVKNIFANPQAYSGLFVILGVLFFTLQIYAEFSGAMDIVTGSAQMFGISLAKNFERPFFSRSVAEFWRRWHMTLGAWLRDYILYSVSLSKWFMKLSKFIKSRLRSGAGKTLPTIIPLFLVWLFCGLWHGASWKYVLYGMYYYAIMAAGMLFEPLFSRLCSALRINREGRLFRALQLVRTFILVNIGMLIFRAPQTGTAFSMLRSVFTGFNLGVLTNGALLKLGMDIHDYYVIAVGCVIMLVVSLLQEKGVSLRERIAEKNIAVRWCIYFAAIFAVIIFGAYGAGYNPVDFIYAQF